MPGSVFDNLLQLLATMALPDGTYAVFGSGPLAARGLIDDVGDLDIVVRGPTWDRVKSEGQIVRFGDHETVDLGNGLTFGRSWAYGEVDIDRIIDEAEMIRGLRFVRLAEVAAYKRIARRPKDLHHLEMLSGGVLPPSQHPFEE